MGLEALDEKLHGTTSLATGTEDPIAPIRLVADYSKKLGDKFNLKAAFMDGKVLSDAEVAVLSTCFQEGRVRTAGRAPCWLLRQPVRCYGSRYRRKEGEAAAE